MKDLLRIISVNSRWNPMQVHSFISPCELLFATSTQWLDWKMATLALKAFDNESYLWLKICIINTWVGCSIWLAWSISFVNTSYTLPETNSNSSLLKIGLLPQKERSSSSNHQFSGAKRVYIYIYMGVEPKIVVFTPQIIPFLMGLEPWNFHHPFWGVITTIFGKTLVV